MNDLIQAGRRAAGDALELLAFDPTALSSPEISFRLALMIVLLCGSAFFSSAESALFSLSRLQLREMQRAGDPTGRTIFRLLNQPRRLIISILCGNQLVNVAATANMSSIMLLLYTPEAAVLANLLLMVPLLLLFGEVTPKSIAVTNPVLVSRVITARPMAAWVRLVTPLRWLVQGLSKQITDWVGGEERPPESILHVDELRLLVDDVVASGELHGLERTLIDNLLAAGSTEVREIMLPRTRIDFIDAASPASAVLATIRRCHHRQFPVYRGQPDAVIGLLHTEDLARRVLDGSSPDDFHVEALLRPVAAVPASRKIDELFAYFVAQQSRAALVVDEFGGVEGMITLSDLVVYIFGAGDASVAGSQTLRENPEGAWEVDGALRIDALNRLLGADLRDRRYTTIAGLMLHRMDHTPEVGDSLEIPGATLRILELDGLRIARVLIEVEPGEGPPERDEGNATPPFAIEDSVRKEGGRSGD